MYGLLFVMFRATERIPNVTENNLLFSSYIVLTICVGESTVFFEGTHAKFPKTNCMSCKYIQETVCLMLLHDKVTLKMYVFGGQ